jgi:hypothetical protein
MIEDYSTEEVIECCQEYLKVERERLVNPIFITRVGWMGRAPMREKCSSTLITKK